MKNGYFQFKQFTVHQDLCAMKVCTDACLFAAWVAAKSNTLRMCMHDMLDIGTGTGLLSLMMAQKTDAFTDAIEMDRPAYEQAIQNIAGSPWNDRIRAIHADVKEFAFQKTYDLIISNPPFFESDLLSPEDAGNIARHSSHLTLQQLMAVVAGNLSDNGYFAVLLPYHRTEYVQTLAGSFHIHLHTRLLVRHSSLHPYFRSCLLFSRSEQAEPVMEEIAIKNEGHYTEKFSRLLKDYYLHF